MTHRASVDYIGVSFRNKKLLGGRGGGGEKYTLKFANLYFPCNLMVFKILPKTI